MSRFVLGVDVAKLSFQTAFWKEGMTKEIRELPNKGFTRDRLGVRQLGHWLESHGVTSLDYLEVVMDSTGRYSQDLMTLMNDRYPTWDCAIVNPKILKNYANSLGLRNKTDSADCRAHCLYGIERKPYSSPILSPVQEELKELGRTRRYLMEILVATKNRLAEVRLKSVLAIHRSIIKKTGKDIARIEEKMKNLIDADEQLKNDRALILTVPGVGRITSLAILAELGDFRRFEHARQISAFSGLSPKRHQSGPREGLTTISRQGSPFLRSILHMPALACITHGKSLRVFYKRLVDRGLAKKAALAAVSRKVLVIMWAVVIKQTPYCEEFHISQMRIAAAPC